MLADGAGARAAATLHLAGGIICYRPYRCADGYVTLGALEPKFWAEFCRGVGREDLLEHAFDPPGSDAHRAVERDLRRAHPRAVAGVRHRARLLPRAGARARRGARLRAGGGAGDGGRARAARRGAAGQAARRAVQAEPDARPIPTRAPGPGLGEHTDEVLAAAGYSEEEIAALHEAGAVAGPAAGAVQGSFLSA